MFRDRPRPLCFQVGDAGAGSPHRRRARGLEPWCGPGRPRRVAAHREGPSRDRRPHPHLGEQCRRSSGRTPSRSGGSRLPQSLRPPPHGAPSACEAAPAGHDRVPLWPHPQCGFHQRAGAPAEPRGFQHHSWRDRRLGQDARQGVAPRHHHQQCAPRRHGHGAPGKAGTHQRRTHWPHPGTGPRRYGEDHPRRPRGRSQRDRRPHRLPRLL